MKTSVLILQDGTTLYGQNHGAQTTKIGELCFNTGMTGYQELFSDPSYFGQMLIMTSNHIGNYGVLETENESETPKIFGLICKEFSPNFSRPVSSVSLQEYLEKYQIPAISGIDTRMLVRHIRKNGSMNAIISTQIDQIEDLKEQLAAAPSMKGLELASRVTCPKPYIFGDSNSPKKIAVYDFGIKKNILRCLNEFGYQIHVFPAQSPAEELLAIGPNGIFLSNGPGDPASMDYAIENIKKILETDIPIFGICMGHQLLALALGAKTYKLHNGHRGLNHPVINLELGKSEITSQNHGFGVDDQSLQTIQCIKVTHRNLNDQTIEGIRIEGKKAFSVQYHPESSPGPHDSRYLFEQFKEMIG